MGSFVAICFTIVLGLVAAFAFALLAKRLRRDWRLLRGEGVRVEARVCGHETVADSEGTSRCPVYSFRSSDGVDTRIVGGAEFRLPPVGSRRTLVYLPGAPQEAEPAGLSTAILAYPLLLGAGGFAVYVLVALFEG